MIDPENFDSNKYSSNNLKDLALEVGLEYPKELNKLHNGYHLALDKVEIKKDIFFDYQFKIADFHNIPTGPVKKMVA